MSPDRAALGQLEFAGWVFDLAFRLRGSTTSPAPRVLAIGLDVGLANRDLKSVLVALEQLGWLSVQREDTGTPVSVTETLPSPGELVAAAPQILDVAAVTTTERAALAILRATTLQPLLLPDALQTAASGASGAEEASADALRYLTATGLIRRVVADDGREVVYNPNVWTQGDEIARAALRAADAYATTEVTALLEELAANPGLPEAGVKSTEPKWVQFAISQGLVQRSVIQTSEGTEKGFLFTPHLGRDPFGRTAGDASGQVRQLVGSMMYATTYAKYRLHSPDVFLNALINRGVAGDVSSIGTDYQMLEKAGIVRVVQGSTSNRFALELLQSEVAEDALKLLAVRETSSTGQADAAALRAQRSYIHVERDRAKLALSSDVDEIEQARLIAALRDASVSRAWNNR
jgi:hypothetical protein